MVNIVMSVLALLAASCGDSDDEVDAAVEEVTESESGAGSGDETSDDDNGADVEPLTGSGSTAELESVFTLAPGDWSVLFPYNEIEDETVFTRTATFLGTGSTVADLVSFYELELSELGYETNQLELGESIALNISDPADPNVLGVVQSTMNADGTLTLNMELTHLKEPGSDAAEDEDPAPASSSSDGAAD